MSKYFISGKYSEISEAFSIYLTNHDTATIVQY